MIKTFRMLLGLLTARERRKFSWLVLVMLLVGIFETAGVASILPFMAVLAEPDRIQTSAQLSAIYDALNFTSVPGFLIFLGLGTFVMTMMGIGMHLLSLYTITRFNHECSYMLSCQLLSGYLSQPYAWFLNRHSADLGKAVLSEVDQVVSQSLVPAMGLLVEHRHRALHLDLPDRAAARRRGRHRARPRGELRGDLPERAQAHDPLRRAPLRRQRRALQDRPGGHRAASRT